MAFKWNGAHMVYLFALLMFPSVVTSLETVYCSPQNTGSDFDAVTDTFQSNGACYSTCVANYAFAVLQGKQCWCSNYIPAAKSPTGSCNEKCAGYPSDMCGSPSDGLFAYFALDERPSGTATGGGSPSETTLVVSNFSFLSPAEATTISMSTLNSQQKTPFSTMSTLTTFLTVGPQVLTVTVQSTTSAAETKTVTATLSLTTDPPSTSSTTKAPPTTAGPGTSVTTVAGEIVTITKPNEEPASTSDPAKESSDGGSSLSGGAIAGIIIGVLAIVVIAALCIWFVFFRRRRSSTPENPDSRLDPSIPNSAYLNGNRQNRSSQMSMMNSLFDTNGHSNSNGNRLSVPAFTDHRMKKDAVIYGNDGRESNVSLQDNQDYSRPVLRLANPDM